MPNRKGAHKMKKTFLYIPTLYTGGAERQCVLIASELKGRGCDIEILVDNSILVNAVNQAIVNESNIHVVTLPAGFLRKVFYLIRLFRKHKGAVVISFLTRPNFTAGLASIFVRHIHLYSEIRCGKLPARKLAIEWLTHKLLSTKTVFNSYRAFNTFTARGFNRQKCLVITNAFISTLIERRKHKGIVIVAVGRFIPEKDYYTWLRVVRKVLDEGVSIQAKIQGWGAEEDRIREWVSTLGLDSAVSILPGAGDVSALLGGADIYLSTSLSEGVSNSIMEAMNAKLPVVATDVGDNERLIETGCSGFLAKVGDVEELAKCVIRLAENHKMREEFGERAFDLLAKRFSLRTIVDEYQSLLEKE